MFDFKGTRKPDFTKIDNIDYNQYWGKRGFKINKKLKERELIILDFVQPFKKVLDLGCGNSLLPIALKNKRVDISVADISSDVLNGFSKCGIKSVNVDLEKTSLIDFNDKFDYIILSEVLEHTKNPEEIIIKLKQFTNNFIISIPNSAFYRYRTGLLFKGRFLTQWVYHPSEHLRFWSHIDFLDWLDAMGVVAYKVVSSNGFSFFGLLPSLKNLWKNMFGHQIIYFCKIKDEK